MVKTCLDLSLDIACANDFSVFVQRDNAAEPKEIAGFHHMAHRRIFSPANVVFEKQGIVHVDLSFRRYLRARIFRDARGGEPTSIETCKMRASSLDGDLGISVATTSERRQHSSPRCRQVIKPLAAALVID